MLDSLLVPSPDSGPDSGPPTPCSSYPNISKFKRMYMMLLFREVWLQDPPISLLRSLTVRTVMCFGSCCMAIFDRCNRKTDIHTITYQELVYGISHLDCI
jgi:hypothetical protein